jgi:hypothetical protein
VLEVWESQEDAQRFVQERLLPAFEAAGVERLPNRPEIWSIHNVLK